MKEIVARYIIGLLAGIIIGILYPTLIPTWLFILIPFGVVAVTELIGKWGFGHRWHDYRGTGYLLHSGVAVCVLFGLLLGNGSVGKFLVWLGTLIS